MAVQLLAAVAGGERVMAYVDGALAARVFHSGALSIRKLKQYLREAGIEVRL